MFDSSRSTRVALHEASTICGSLTSRDFFELLLIGVLVQLADEIEQVGDRAARVEIVVHLLQEARPQLAARLSSSGIAARIDVAGCRASSRAGRLKNRCFVIF